MFKEFADCPVIANLANNLLNLITASKVASVFHGYYIHTHRFEKRETEKKFWAVQAAIVRALRVKRSLISILVFIHPSCDATLATVFRRAI